MTISLKKKISFEQLVQDNKKQIMQDASLLERIERDLEMKMNQTLEKKES
ncbi:FbpB family small basic protein [Oceanobacillus picturae]|nr:FbpB family small basic protein [Oceanobacillus picturae]